MPNRIGITEAPSADLEKEGQLLHLPLARKDAQGQIQPRSTTIAQVIATAQNDVKKPSQIHRIHPDLQNSPVYNMPANLQPYTDSGNFNLLWDKNTIETLQGDEGFIQIDGDEITPGEAGIYRITMSLSALYTNQVEGGEHIWLPILGIFTVGEGEHIPGTALAPNPFSNGLTTRLGKASYTGSTNGFRGIATTLEMRNIGKVATPSPSTEALQITDVSPRGQSLLVIEFLGKQDEK